MRKCNTFGKPWSSANTPGRPYKRFKINILTVTSRRTVPTTITRKATQHKTPSEPVTAQKEGPPRKTQHWPHSHPIHSRTGGKLQEDMYKIWNPDTFKGNRTLKPFLVKPKDQDPKEQKSGVIYSYQCGEIACNEEYIRETSTNLGKGTGSI